MNLPIAATQWYKKTRKIVIGALNTYVRKIGEDYESDKWWDNVFYSSGITSDASTISKHTGQLVSRYHYASIELGLLALLFNNNLEIKGKRVCDIGSGSGHWIEFFDSLEAQHVSGFDVSRTACDFLTDRFHDRPTIKIECGKALDISGGKYDIVNAIGVMFHIVDDTEWVQSIQAVAETLEKGGILIVGGHFGLLNNLNVQYDGNLHVNKRLRSARQWTRTLRANGFKKIVVWQNRAYLNIKWLVPESNLILALK